MRAVILGDLIPSAEVTYENIVEARKQIVGEVVLGTEQGYLDRKKKETANNKVKITVFMREKTHVFENGEEVS